MTGVPPSLVYPASVVACCTAQEAVEIAVGMLEKRGKKGDIITER